jgi:S1-C subfamily serine protease
VVQIVVRARGSKVPPSIQWCFNDAGRCILGTGFFVNSEADVVTAFHVVDGFKTKDEAGKVVDHPGIKQFMETLEQAGVPAEVQVGVALPNIESSRMTMTSGNAYFPAKIVATDPSHDLAVIQATVNPFAHMTGMLDGAGSVGKAEFVSISTVRPGYGAEVFSCGYPFSSDGLVNTAGTIASAWNTKVLIRAAASGSSMPVEVYEVDLRINPGNSGGPVFRSSDQALIGVTVEGLGSLGVAVPAKFVSAFLDANKIAWHIADAKATKEPSRH